MQAVIGYNKLITVFVKNMYNEIAVVHVVNFRNLIVFFTVSCLIIRAVDD